MRLIPILFLLVFAACSNPVDSRWEEVIGLHDAVMPDMAKITRHKGQINKILQDSASSLDSTDRAALIETLLLLEKGDKGMWDWMAEAQHWDALRDSLPREELLRYLDERENSIRQVGMDMTRGISQADSLLKVLQQ